MIIRSMSPDSVIESGSDTTSMSTAAVIIPRASLRANERDRPKQHEIESQFGSLTSINIAAGALDDDLDSGIDGGKLNNRFHTAPKADVLRHADTSRLAL
jgi:DNA polymerase III sliding clamp (beta) subunit (PCNA family)